MVRGPARRTTPDLDATEAVAYEWLDGSLPSVASPHRAEFILTLMSDWPRPLTNAPCRLVAFDEALVVDQAGGCCREAVGASHWRSQWRTA